MKLDNHDRLILKAVVRAVAPRSAYIAHEVDRLIIPHMRRDRILRKLRRLEKTGLLECVGGPDGYYGFTWKLTDEGKITAGAV